MVTGNRGAQIVDLREARGGRLEQALRDEIASGRVIVKMANVDSVEEWRAAARRLGRAHGWRVRTGVTRDGHHVWAARLDLEPSLPQAQRDCERIRYLGAAITP